MLRHTCYYSKINLIRNLSTKAENTKLFDKILVANRGEIACRVFRTTKKLGIKSVAIFSDADKDSLHSEMADEAYRVGEAPSSESYLSIEKVIQVANKVGAKAIHPGYGFLSENDKFAKVLQEAGIKFIGPPVQALKDMGSKSASKEIMTRAGVPVVPGYHGTNQDREFLRQEASKIGYPIMIKAVLGGGGKGMRIVRSPEEFDEMLDSSKRESMKSFNDDRVLLEKYIERPRHVEVQVFGDMFGEAVYLFERDCSVQRRHQKILEEAPAPGLSEKQRSELGLMAVAAAKAVNYEGAGTVEFIFDTDTGKFYFMEMNTRLQVEHPVTEMITNLDLVHWQLMVASGRKLPLTQDQVNRHGHAIEARIYAENTKNNFMPDTGLLEYLRFPENTDDIRIETGVREGDLITVYYDPMIAKVIVWGEDRLQAIRKLDQTLQNFHVVGVRTNIELIRRVLAQESFQAGSVDTSFIKKHEKELFSNHRVNTETVALAAMLQFLKPKKENTNKAGPWNNSFINFQGFIPRSSQIKMTNDGNAYLCDITAAEGYGNYIVHVKGRSSGEIAKHNVRINDSAKVTAAVDGKKYGSLKFFFDSKSNLHLFLQTGQISFGLENPSASVGASETEHSVYSPMPCRVGQVQVKPGDQVKKGSILMIVEAMKMEHVIKAPKDCRIKRIFYSEGDLVGEKKQLVEFDD